MKNKEEISKLADAESIAYGIPDEDCKSRDCFMDGFRRGYTACQEEEDEWIPISNPPKERGRYLAWIEEIGELGKSNYVWNLYFGGGDYWSDNLVIYTPTHWKPLPNPPNK